MVAVRAACLFGLSCCLATLSPCLMWWMLAPSTLLCIRAPSFGLGLAGDVSRASTSWLCRCCHGCSCWRSRLATFCNCIWRTGPRSRLKKAAPLHHCTVCLYYCLKLCENEQHQILNYRKWSLNIYIIG